MPRSLLVLALLNLASRAHAQGVAFAVEKIEVRRWDQRRALLVSEGDKDLDPYGAAQQVAIVVTVATPPEISGKLTLEVKGARYADEATGEHKAWKEKRVETISGSGEAGRTHVLFLVPQNCHAEVTITAQVNGGAPRKLKTGFFCAE